MVDDARLTQDELFLARFEACQWPFEKWHHRDHVKLAYLYLLRYPLAEATERIRAAIRAHNAAHQRPESPTTGYHETITQTWLRLVQSALRETGPAPTADQFVDAHPELWDWQRVRSFYSAELLWSPRAKAEFVPPDLAPLPSISER